jgi:secondary thiamine-phosphate synthase enzyme
MVTDGLDVTRAGMVPAKEEDVEAPGDMTRMKAFSATFTLAGEEPTEVLDITKRVREAIQQFPVTTGIALVNTMHTTCALFINEFQHALVDDLKSLAERLVPERGGYRHDDPRYSGCERGNAHAHLRTALLGRSVAVGIANGELVMGRFQSIIFAEFDGPRKRDVTVQVLGE